MSSLALACVHSAAAGGSIDRSRGNEWPSSSWSTVLGTGLGVGSGCCLCWSNGGTECWPAAITLDGWARFVADLVGRQAEPVILVGHSRGGVVTGQAADLV